jgi:hypothetical protein
MRAKFEPMTDSQWQFTKKFLNIECKRKHDLRLIFDAIRWLNKTGLRTDYLSKMANYVLLLS